MTIASIAPVADRARPFWSVMIPTYRPRADHLDQAVAGVTAQLAPGADVEIEIVDDASPNLDVEALRARHGAAGVHVHRNNVRLGLAGNWNRCLERARGRWVHVLHQDDFVLPGFYAALRGGIEAAQARAQGDDGHGRGVGAAFCDTWFLDHRDHRRRRTLVREHRAGVLGEWAEHVFVRLAVQTPSIVVAREVYETLGGFDDAFEYALDWDMWKRIAAAYALWYEPRALACYRAHAQSQTSRMRADGRNITEIAASIERSRTLLAPAEGTEIARRARRAYCVFALENVFESLLRDRAPGAARAQWAAARRLSSRTDLARALTWLALRTAASPLRCLRHPLRDHARFA